MARAKRKETEDKPKVPKPVVKAPTRTKQDGTPLSRSERAEALLYDVNAKMKGRAVLQRASEYRLPYLTKRLPTGLLTLDLALKGGFPAGGISQITGKRSGGKSSVEWMIIRQLQDILGDDMKVLLAMTEIPADRKQGKNLGCRISLGEEDIQSMNRARVQAGYPAYTKEELAWLRDEVGTIHELHAITAEDFYDVILRAIEENMYHAIFIDSIGNVLAAAEQENASVHDKTYAGAAAPNTTFLKKMTSLLTMKTAWGEVRDTCVIAINQIRDDIKNPEKAYRNPGGQSLEHAKLLDIYLESGSQIGDNVPVYTVDKEGPKTKQQWVPTGKQVNWTIMKGKAGMHEGARGAFVFDYRINNLDYYTDTLIAGVQNGVIQAAGAWLTIPRPGGGHPILTANGKEKFIAALGEDAQVHAEDPENSVMNFVRTQCFRVHEINIDYDSFVP